jgi:hypothetical protein
MKMKPKLKIQISKVKCGLFAAAAGVLFAAAAQAAVNSNAGIIFPEIENGCGPRAAAMAGAYTAVADDAASIYWNPAGLSQVKKTQIALTYDSWFVDAFFNNATAAVPLSTGVLGAEVFYMNFGSFANVDDFGNSLSGSVSPFTLAAFLAYGIGLNENFSAGVSAKVITQSQGSISKTGFAGDIGLMYKTGIFSAGLAARNFGGGAGSPLPSDVRLGLAVSPVIVSSHKLILAADASYIFGDAFYAGAGAEYTIEKVVSLRAGYKYRTGGTNLQGLAGITAGLGAKIGGIGFDYAFMPFGELGVSHRAALNFEFGESGAVVPKQEKQEKQEKEQPVSLTKNEQQMYNMFFEAGTLENSGNLTAAADKYKEMLKEDSTYAPAWKRLGAVFVKMKKTQQAVKCFESYLKLKPDDTAVKNWLKKNK